MAGAREEVSIGGTGRGEEGAREEVSGVTTNRLLVVHYGVVLVRVSYSVLHRH